jgi:hypothetical protein
MAYNVDGCVRLNSSDATYINDEYSWEINDHFLRQYGSYKISLVQAVLPNHRYPVNETNQNVYFSIDGGVTQTFVVPENDYTATQLAATLQTLFSTTSGFAHTVSYDLQSNKLTISVVGHTIGLVPGTAALTLFMGFPATSAVATSITSVYPVKLDGTSFLEAVMSFSCQASYSSSGIQGVAALIPMTVPFGYMLFYNPSVPDVYFTVEQSFSRCSIKFRDDHRNQWVVPLNVTFSIVLHIDPINT